MGKSGKDSFGYSEFDNYGLELPFSENAINTAGKRVEGAFFIDIRSQALRLDPFKRIELMRDAPKARYSAGIWFFGEHSSRFHGSYKAAVDIEKRLEMAAELKECGLSAIEAHDPWEISQENLDLYKRLYKEDGISVSVVAGIGGDFRATDSRFGTTSSPLGEVRKKYSEHTIRQLELVREIAEYQDNPPVAVCWPGVDGYAYPLGTDFYDMWDRFEAALAEALDEVPGVRVAIEPKPYEPAINNIWRNTADGMIMARNVEARLRNPVNRRLLDQGHCLVGLNPEIGHVRMGFEDVAGSYSAVMRDGRLAHTHWNAQPLGNFDQDLNPGVVAPECLEALVYVCRMYNYTGFFGLDLNPEKMPVEAAIARSINAIELARGVVDNIDPAEILQAYHSPNRYPGRVEDILTRARAAGIDHSRLVPREILEKYESRSL